MSVKNLPPFYIPQKRRAEELPRLHSEMARLEDAIKSRRKKVKAEASYSAEFGRRAQGLEFDPGRALETQVQLDFRAQLLKDYNSLNENKDAWCPILGVYLDADEVTASHLFAYKHGQEAMDAIFGEIRPAELFSSRNGLIISRAIEKYFDSGVLVILPDLPDKSMFGALSSWVNQDVQNYKVRIIDSEWEKLDKEICAPGGLRWRDLDNRKLQFRSK